jgi:pre-mRNA-splicing helicase BRR2
MILYCTLLASAQSLDEKKKIEDQMRDDPELLSILNSLENDSIKEERNDDVEMKNDDDNDNDEIETKGDQSKAITTGQHILNLEDLQFSQGGHLMANKKCQLPEGSFRKQKKGYEEVHVPASKPKILEKHELASIDSLPRYVQPIFEGFKSLNATQTIVHKAALETDENLLICAPTGAGKTNIAILTMMREIGKHVNESDGRINTDSFKVILNLIKKTKKTKDNISSLLDYLYCAFEIACTRNGW